MTDHSTSSTLRRIGSRYTVVLAIVGVISAFGIYLAASSVDRPEETVTAEAMVFSMRLDVAPAVLSSTASDIFATDSFAEQVIERAGLADVTTEGLVPELVELARVGTTSALRVVARSTDPALAADVANTAAFVLVEELNQSPAQLGVFEVQIEAMVRDQLLDEEMIIPVLLALVGGLAVAFGVAVGLAFVTERRRPEPNPQSTGFARLPSVVIDVGGINVQDDNGRAGPSTQTGVAVGTARNRIDDASGSPEQRFSSSEGESTSPEARSVSVNTLNPEEPPVSLGKVSVSVDGISVSVDAGATSHDEPSVVDDVPSGDDSAEEANPQPEAEPSEFIRRLREAAAIQAELRRASETQAKGRVGTVAYLPDRGSQRHEPRIEEDSEIVMMIQGIGQAYNARLATVGIKTVAELATFDADQLSELIGVGVSSTRSWVSQARAHVERERRFTGEA